MPHTLHLDPLPCHTHRHVVPVPAAAPTPELAAVLQPPSALVAQPLPPAQVADRGASIAKWEANTTASMARMRMRLLHAGMHMRRDSSAPAREWRTKGIHVLKDILTLSCVTCRAFLPLS